jgi:hypothetical protein
MADLTGNINLLAVGSIVLLVIIVCWIGYEMKMIEEILKNTFEDVEYIEGILKGTFKDIEGINKNTEAMKLELTKMAENLRDLSKG